MVRGSKPKECPLELPRVNPVAGREFALKDVARRRLCKGSLLDSSCQPMQRSVLSGYSDKAMCAPVVALDRFAICHFARIKQFKSVEVDVVEILILSFIRDENLSTVNDHNCSFIQDPLIRWRIQFTREKYGTTMPAEDDTDMVGSFDIGRPGIIRMSTPVPDEIESWLLEAQGRWALNRSQKPAATRGLMRTVGSRAPLDGEKDSLCAAKLLTLGS